MNYLQFCSFVILLALRLALLHFFFAVVSESVYVCNFQFRFFIRSQSRREVWSLTCATVQHTKYIRKRPSCGVLFRRTNEWRKKKNNLHKNRILKLVQQIYKLNIRLIIRITVRHHTMRCTRQLCAARELIAEQAKQERHREQKRPIFAKKMENSTTTFYFASFITSELIPSSFWILNGLFDLLSQFLRANACKLFVFHSD